MSSPFTSSNQQAAGILLLILFGVFFDKIQEIRDKVSVFSLLAQWVVAWATASCVERDGWRCIAVE